jgi:Zn-dependent protease
MRLGSVFGIRIGVSVSWFVFFGVLIIWLTEFFHQVIRGSVETAFFVALAGSIGYFGSLVLHELGHALVARRAGIPVRGIDLWFLGGLSQMEREPESAGEELRVAAAGPAVTALLLVACIAVSLLISGSGTAREAFLEHEAGSSTPAIALVGWLGFVNAMLLFFNILPAFPLDGGRIARAAIWARTGDRNRATRMTGYAGRGLGVVVGIFGLWALAESGSLLGLLTLIVAFFIYQAAGAAVTQGTVGGRIQSLTVSDVMDTEPVVIPSGMTLLDAQEQFFLRYRWPWFAVTDEAAHYLGILRANVVDAEVTAGRPALHAGDIAETDAPVMIKPGAPLESLLGAEGLGRLGAMVAVDADGVLRGIVTLAEIRRALRPAA